MAKLTVWECDKCRKQLTTPTMPSSWVNADVDSDSGGSYLWCDGCWRSIKDVIPICEEVRR